MKLGCIIVKYIYFNLQQNRSFENCETNEYVKICNISTDFTNYFMIANQSLKFIAFYISRVWVSYHY